MNKQLSIIVAIADNNAIGKDNQLLWHLSEDLKRFKQLTTNHTIVMGKKTFDSLPIKPLPNRRSIVITDDLNEKIEGCLMAYSIEDAVNKCDETQENFIIGGGSIYKQFMPIANKLYLTKVHKDFDADTFYTDIDYSKWEIIEKQENLYDEKNKISYSYLIYKRILNLEI
ncbi:MAG: dihydrofolate reductase [Bacteroidetes bacterium]|nr:dihydrofolate reductase [Bacteroidota bacterium]